MRRALVLAIVLAAAAGAIAGCSSRPLPPKQVSANVLACKQFKADEGKWLVSAKYRFTNEPAAQLAAYTFQLQAQGLQATSTKSLRANLSDLTNNWPDPSALFMPNVDNAMFSHRLAEVYDTCLGLGVVLPNG